jgi:hypothetical protein
MSKLEYYERGAHGLEEVKLDRVEILKIVIEAIEKAKATMPPEEFEAALEAFMEWAKPSHH